MSTPVALPSFGRIAAALRLTTEHLAGELRAPRDTAPGWDAFEWQVARAVAAMQGITVLLARGLRWPGPPSWRQFLDAQLRQAEQRDAHIAEVLAKLDHTLRTAGVACVALKGSALRRLDLYRSGERPMGDIDLLARPADTARIAEALRSLDYEEHFRVRRHTVFEPRIRRGALKFGEHVDNPLKIELHERVAEPLPCEAVDITDGLWSDAAAPGLAAYPLTRELMRHLLLHAAGSIRAHALRQLQLHDIALLAGKLADGDWLALLQTPESRGGSWWMWPVLELTARYYPGALPARCADFRERCPPLLRAASARHTLSQVSWSNLRIAAFPGLWWARTAREGLGFVYRRIAPQRAALDELALSVDAAPTLRTVPWYRESRAKRALRWAFSRPPRVQTILAVSAVVEAEAVS